MLRRLLWGLAIAVLLLAAAAVLAAVAALQPEPAVALREEVGVQDVARAVRLLRGHDPRRATPGRQRLAALQERDLEVILGHGAQRWLRAASRVEVQAGQARLQLSAHLPDHPATRLFGRWLNLDVQLKETSGLPVMSQVHLGRLPVPVAWAERAALALVERSGVMNEVRLAADVVQHVRFVPRQMVVRYAWRDDSAQRVLQALLPEAEQRRLRAYNDLLVELAARQRPGAEVALPSLLGPVFERARQRTLAGGDAAAENRAAVIVLTLYVNGRGVDAVSPAARGWPRARPLRVLLGGRVDFPQHFLVSAALALEGTGALSQAIGLYKEVLDSRGGSGFSFTDMAANLAGTRFGEALQRDPDGLQQRLAAGLQDTDLIPLFADLPEMMPEPEFLRRYGGVGAPAYNALQAEIDRRVAALPLLR